MHLAQSLRDNKVIIQCDFQFFSTADNYLSVSDDYLNGLLQLTVQEADFAITTTHVLSVLLAVICIILIGGIIHLKRKSTK